MASNILRNALAYKDSHRQDALMRNKLAAFRTDQAEQERRNALAQSAGGMIAEDDFTGARNTLARGGDLKNALALQGQITGQDKAADERKLAAEERLATFGAQILQLPPEQQQGAYMAVLPQIHETLRGANIDFDPNDTTFDDSDRDVFRGLAAQFNKLPGADKDGNFGVGGVWGKDKDGNPVFLQPSSKGGLYRPPVPDNVTLTEPPKVVGGSIYGGRTGERKTDVTSDLEAGKAAEARGQATGKREGELPELRLKAELAQDQLEIKQDLMLEDIDRAINKASLWTTGFAGSVLNLVPGTSARNLSGIVDSIQAKVGFDELKAMRDASPTGGALGQVTVREIELLQAVLGDLRQAQTEDQFKYHLRRLKSVMGRMRDVRQKAFERQFGDVSTSTQQSAPSQPPEQAQPQVPDAAIQFLMQNPQLADQFDAKYGQGAAQRYLGGQ